MVQRTLLITLVATALTAAVQAQQSATTGTHETGIAVPADQSWTPTGITVRKGDVLTFTATGEVRLSTDPTDISTPTGARSKRRSQTAPIPDVYAGALIAKVGTSAPFPIGEKQTVTMPANGQLSVGINDDHIADNQGSYRVVIERNTRR